MWPALQTHGIGTLVEKLDIVFQELTADRVGATLPLQGNEQAAGRARPVGVNLNVTHQRSARAGMATGMCTPSHLGRRVTTHDIVLSDEAGRRLSTARITSLLLAD